MQLIAAPTKSALMALGREAHNEEQLEPETLGECQGYFDCDLAVQRRYFWICSTTTRYFGYVWPVKTSIEIETPLCILNPQIRDTIRLND